MRRREGKNPEPPWLLGIALLLGMALRWPQLDASLWLDELHSSWAVSDAFADVAPRSRVGNNSPLYFWGLWLVVHTLGQSEWSLRLPSLICGVGLMVAVFGVTHAWTRSGTSAAMAAGLVALDPHCGFYSLETRPYAAVQLLAVLVSWWFWKLVQQPTLGRRCAYWLGMWVLFYLHYTAAILLVPHAIFLLASGKLDGCFRRYSIGQYVIDGLVAAIGVIPASLHLWEIATRRHLWSAFVPHVSLHAFAHLFPLGWYVLLPLFGLGCQKLVNLDRFQKPQSPPGHRTGGRVVDRPVDRPPSGFPPSGFAMFLLLWYFAPLTVAAVLTNADVAPLFHRRYLVVASAAPVLMAGFLVSQCRSRKLRGFLAVGTVLLAGWMGPLATWQTRGMWIPRGNENWRGAVAFVNRCLSESDASQPTAQPTSVYMDAGLIEARLAREESGGSPTAEFFTFPLHGLYAIPPQTPTHPVLQRRKAQEPIDIQPENQAGAILVIRARGVDRRHDWFLDTDTSGPVAFVVGDTRYFGDITVQRGVVRGEKRRK